MKMNGYGRSLAFSADGMSLYSSGSAFKLTHNHVIINLLLVVCS